MTGLTQHDRVMLDDAIEKIYTLGNLDDFAVTAMRELPRLVQSDVTSFNEVNIRARRLVSVLDDPRQEKIYLRKRHDIDVLMMQNPLIARSAATSDGAIKISDFLPDRQWRQTEFYHRLYSQMGVNYQMSISLNLGGNIIVAFALNRSAEDFSERDRAMLTAIQPHVIRAYKNAVQYTQTLTRLKGRERMLDELGAGWIDLDHSFRITRASPTAFQDVTSFFRLQKLDPARLPPEIEKWARQNPGHPASGPAEPFVKLNGRDRLTVTMVRDEEAGEASLLVERFIDRDSPEPLQRLGLTRRQAEVLYWVAQGKTNAEIAIILKISQRTAENHVHAILGQLDVENRTEAAMKACATLSAD